MRRVITNKECNQYCSSNPHYINTYILPPYWQCKYHRFLTSLSSRSPSRRRPRLIREFHRADGYTIAVYIGYYDQEVYELLSNPEPYLSYVVFSSDGGISVYDTKYRSICKISPYSQDENVVWERVRYDFFVALRNGYHEIIKRGQKQTPPTSHVLSRFYELDQNDLSL
jgi:hypothetical protein